MFKRILSALLVAALVVGVSSAVANAVTGKFTLVISLKPQTNNEEKVPFLIDYEAILNLKFTVSGLTFSNQLAMGVTGVEHAVFDFEANLGALTLRVDLVFATPFSDQGAGLNCPGPPLATGGIARGLAPCPSIGPVGPLLFVKKRVTSVISIGGITVENLAIFEDVNFSDPLSSSFLILTGQAVPRPSTDTNGDNRYTQADQRFHFGDALTVKGETPSGIQITAKATFNVVDRWNCVKKKCWFESVIVQPEHRDGTLEKVFFHKEEISIENIRIGALGLDIFLRWQPTGSLDPGFGPGPLFDWEIDASFDLPPIGSILIIFASEAIRFPDTVFLADPVTVASTVTYDVFPFFGNLIFVRHALGSLSITLDGHFNIRGIRNVMSLRLDPAPATVTIVTNLSWGVIVCTGVNAPTPGCAVAGQRIVVSNGLDNMVIRSVIDLGGGQSLLLHTCFGSAAIVTQFLALCGPKPVGSGFAQWAWTRYRFTVRLGSVEFISDGTFTRAGLLENKFFLTFNF